MKTFRLTTLLGKHLLKSGILVHLIVGVVVFHWGAQIIHLIFRSEIFGDLSLSSVVPVPTRAKLNLWILVGSGFFSASLLGSTIVPYFHNGGRERAMARIDGTWWRFAIVTLGLAFLWLTLLFLVQVQVSRGMSDFALKPSVSLFKMWFVWLSICISLTYTVAWISLLINPGVALLITAIGTLGILMMSMLDRFGLSNFSTGFIPSGDLGFDFWKWLNGEPLPGSVMGMSFVSAVIMVLLFAVTLRYLPRFRRAMLIG